MLTDMMIGTGDVVYMMIGTVRGCLYHFDDWHRGEVGEVVDTTYDFLADELVCVCVAVCACVLVTACVLVRRLTRSRRAGPLHFGGPSLLAGDRRMANNGCST